MSNNLNLEMRINAHTSDLTAALSKSTAEVSRFERATINSFGRMGKVAAATYQKLNGFSGTSYLLGAAGGVSLVKDLIHTNA